MTLTQTRSFEAGFAANMKATEAARLAGESWPCGRCDAQLVWNKDAIRDHTQRFHADEINEGLVAVEIGGGL